MTYDTQVSHQITAPLVINFGPFPCRNP